MLTKPESILDLTSLTKLQSDALKIRLAQRKNKINSKESKERREISGIKRGSYHRILGQAKNSIKESIFTVAFVVQMGLVNLEDVQRLIASASTVHEGLEREKADPALALLAALADQIVMV